MFSRNLSVPDFVRRFFVSCAQISEAYAVRTVMKFGCDWRKIGHKGRCRKGSERTSSLRVFHNFFIFPSGILFFLYRLLKLCPQFTCILLLVRLMRPFTIQEDTFSYLSRQIPPFSAGSLHFMGQ